MELTGSLYYHNIIVLQLLNARSCATQEIVELLEQECEAVLECRQCRSLFRSLANFVAHKRIHCLVSL